MKIRSTAVRRPKRAAAVLATLVAVAIGAGIGLGTDVGSLAICYRKDLFAKAGLPSNRDAVSKLWPSWQAYIAAGKRYQAKAPKGTFFFDSGSNVYNAMIAQVNPAYYD